MNAAMVDRPYSNGNVAERPQSRIEGVLGDATTATTNLHDRINELEVRLSAVLSPEPPSTVKETGGPRAAAVSVADRIMETSMLVSRATERVQSLLQRLEV